MLHPAPAYEPLESPPETLLDRRVDVTRIPATALAWTGVLVLAALTRLVQWGTWPLGTSEARAASDGLALLQNGAAAATSWAQPLQTELVGLSLFFFGPGDGAVRVVPAVAGLATVLLILGLRRWVGPNVALAAGFLAAVSPTMTQVSRRADAGALLTLASLGLLLLLLRYLSTPGPRIAAAAGVVVSLLVLSSPLGWIALPLVAIAAWLLADERHVRSVDLAPGALGLVVTLVVLGTALLTLPAGLADFFAASLRALWDTYLGTAGAAWQMTPFQLVIDEFLPVILAIAAVVAVALRRDRETDAPVRETRGLLVWAVLATVVATIFGGKDLPLYAFAALPWVLLGGVGFAMLMGAVGQRSLTRWQPVAFVVVVFLALAAFVDTLGLLTSPPLGSAFAWILTGAIFVLLVLLPLVGLSLWVVNRLEQPARPLLGLLGVLLLLVMTSHSTFLLGTTNVQRPGEPLNVGSTSPTVTDLVGRIGRLSADMTTFDQTPQDPAGGHGLTIVVDQAIAQPFAWYFRAYPNLTVVSSASAPVIARTTEVIIVRPDHLKALEPTAGYVARSYAMTLTAPASLASPNWQTLLPSLVNPSQIRQFGSFMMGRQVTTPPAPETFDLVLRSDLAQKMFGTTAP